MIRHIVMWSFQEDLSEAAKKEAVSKIKNDLSRLVGIVPGLVSLEVVTDVLDSSSHDIGLFCDLESEEALKGYQVHPEHVKAAGFIKSVTCNRICLDYVL
ncbi:MAG TPA: Dabb family protein [Candidatus Blautia faecipullorum]|nr:Dabb family protein [Candidatus Blautia faecipullorum]